MSLVFVWREQLVVVSKQKAARSQAQECLHWARQLIVRLRCPDMVCVVLPSKLFESCTVRVMPVATTYLQCRDEVPPDSC